MAHARAYNRTDTYKVLYTLVSPIVSCILEELPCQQIILVLEPVGQLRFSKTPSLERLCTVCSADRQETASNMQSISSLAALLLLSSTATIVCAQNQDLVVNGDFESGYDGWNSVGEGWSLNSDEYFGGGQSAQIQSSVGADWAGLEQLIDLSQGTAIKTITLRGEGMVDDMAAASLKAQDFAMVMTPQFEDGTFGDQVVVPYPQIEGYKWQQFYTRYNPPKPVASVRIGCQVRNLQDGNVYCDSFALAQADGVVNITTTVAPTPIAPTATDTSTSTGPAGPGPNLLVDPDFEFQTPGAWQPVGKGFTTGNDEQYSGQIAAQIAAPVGPAFAGLVQVVELNQKLPQKIVYSGYIMVDESGSGVDPQDVQLLYNVTYVSGDVTAQSIAMPDVNAWTWQRLGGEIDPTLPVKSIAVGCAARNLDSGNVYCDNFQVAQYPAPTGVFVETPTPSPATETPATTVVPTPIPTSLTTSATSSSTTSATSTTTKPTATTPPPPPCTCQPWSGYSACIVTSGMVCGKGQRSRVRECTGSAAAKNDPQCKTEESMPCEIICQTVNDNVVAVTTVTTTATAAPTQGGTSQADTATTSGSSDSSSGGSSTGAIVGAVLGTLAAVAIVGGLAAWYFMKKKRAGKQMEMVPTNSRMSATSAETPMDARVNDWRMQLAQERPLPSSSSFA